MSPRFMTVEGVGPRAVAGAGEAGRTAEVVDGSGGGGGGLTFSRESVEVLSRRRSHLYATTSEWSLGSVSRGDGLGYGALSLELTRGGEPKVAKRRAALADAINYCKYLVSGALSAVVARSCVAPFERVKIEILLHNVSTNSWDTAKHILRQEGVLGFWKGNGLNLLRTAPHKALNFTCYDVYSHGLRQMVGPESLSTEDAETRKNVARFVAGAMAGMTATLLCFPLDVLRVRMLAPGGSPYGSLISTVKGIARKEGISKFYTGVTPALISMAPSGAVFYSLYDIMKDLTLRRRAEAMGLSSTDGLELTSLETLLYGGLAGATAEGFVYPLEVVRRQMQLSTIRSAREGAASGRTTQYGNGLAQMIAAGTRVMRTDGLRGFYNGVAPAMFQVLPNAALSYFTYEACKKALNASPLATADHNHS